MGRSAYWGSAGARSLPEKNDAWRRSRLSRSIPVRWGEEDEVGGLHLKFPLPPKSRHQNLKRPSTSGKTRSFGSRNRRGLNQPLVNLMRCWRRTFLRGVFGGDAGGHQQADPPAGGHDPLGQFRKEPRRY